MAEKALSKRGKTKQKSMMEPREGSIRKGKEGIRPREFRSGNRESGQNPQEGGQGGGSSPEERWVLCSGPHAGQDFKTCVCRPLALRVQGQSLGGNARNGLNAGCSVPNRGQGEGRTRAATAGSLTSKQLVLTAEGPAHPSRATAGHPGFRAPRRYQREGCKRTRSCPHRNAVPCLDLLSGVQSAPGTRPPPPAPTPLDP